MPSDEKVEKVARDAAKKMFFGLDPIDCHDDSDTYLVTFETAVKHIAAALAAAEAGEPVASWECFRDEAFFDMWCVRPKGERRFGHSFHVTTEEEAEGLVALLSASPPSEASRDERAAIRKEAFEEAARMVGHAAAGLAADEQDERQLLDDIATAVRARGET